MILLVILIFPSNCQSTLSVVPGHILSAVQELGNHVLSTGMLLHEEASHVRPSWRVWAHIEAKRRTLISIYFLHWANSAYHGTRHFNCLQLGRMLAVGPKWLWQATDEETWMNLYPRWLAQWGGKELIQAEFFLVERGPVMDSRVERWLEDADELGLLMMTISEKLFSCPFLCPGWVVDCWYSECLPARFIQYPKCGGEHSWIRPMSKRKIEHSMPRALLTCRRVADFTVLPSPTAPLLGSGDAFRC